MSRIVFIAAIIPRLVASRARNALAQIVVSDFALDTGGVKTFLRIGWRADAIRDIIRRRERLLEISP